MNIVPVIFAFDNNLNEAAAVCFYSLLKNSNKDTFYRIHILHSPVIKLDEKYLKRVTDLYDNCEILFHPVDQTFEEAYEIRHVTKATYYRLLIPLLFPQYDRVIYADVDIIFRRDLNDAYNIDFGDNYLAACLDMGMNSFDMDHINTLKIVKQWEYIQAGFIVMNLELIRRDSLVDKFIAEASQNYKYQDQDILNVVCHNRIKYLEPYWNVNDGAYIRFYGEKDILPEWITEESIEEAKEHGNIHYSGYKPWNGFSVAFDIWWEYYRKSPIFDEQRYFKFFFDKTMFLDSLSLWKRIKCVVRFFKNGRYKC